MEQTLPLTPTVSPPPPTISRAERAHYRLSWNERLARNARAATAGQLTLKLFGIPESFASWLDLRGAEREQAASLALYAQALGNETNTLASGCQ